MKCDRCPALISSGTICSSCRRVQSEYCAQRAKEKKARGECYGCSNRAVEGKSRCETCAARQTKNNAKSRSRHIETRLSNALRVRLRLVIRRNQKSGSAVRDLGCTVAELRAHLEKQFQPGMTWENWGVRGWHIDHVRPLASFDLTDRAQFLQACHYTNLQPLWAADNLLKGAK